MRKSAERRFSVASGKCFGPFGSIRPGGVTAKYSATWLRQPTECPHRRGCGIAKDTIAVTVSRGFQVALVRQSGMPRCSSTSRGSRPTSSDCEASASAPELPDLHRPKAQRQGGRLDPKQRRCYARFVDSPIGRLERGHPSGSQRTRPCSSVAGQHFTRPVAFASRTLHRAVRRIAVAHRQSCAR